VEYGKGKGEVYVPPPPPGKGKGEVYVPPPPPGKGKGEVYFPPPPPADYGKGKGYVYGKGKFPKFSFPHPMFNSALILD